MTTKYAGPLSPKNPKLMGAKTMYVGPLSINDSEACFCPLLSPLESAVYLGKSSKNSTKTFVCRAVKVGKVGKPLTGQRSERSETPLIGGFRPALPTQQFLTQQPQIEFMKTKIMAILAECINAQHINGKETGPLTDFRERLEALFARYKTMSELRDARLVPPAYPACPGCRSNSQVVKSHTPGMLHCLRAYCNRTFAGADSNSTTAPRTYKGDA